MRIYLAGPINGCSDEQANEWRARATTFLGGMGIDVVDPMTRDYRGQEAANVTAIVNGDLVDIASADALLVNAERPSWGTAMEVAIARRQMRKTVFAFVGAGCRVSPWLAYHARVVETLDDAIIAIAVHVGKV